MVNSSSSGVTTVEDFEPSALAQIEAILDHLNANHADTVTLVARSLAPDVADAELAGVDPAGANFAVRLIGGRSDRVRLEFGSVVADAHEVQGALLAAVGAARAVAPPDEPLTSLESELAETASLRTVHGAVTATRRLTASMLEVTIGGFFDSPVGGGDDFVYVLISHAAGGVDPAYDMSDYRDQADDDPVRGAYYTVRRARPEVGEIDLWVVEHDHPGTVADWMRCAEPGAPLAMWGPRHGFRIPPDAARLLLVADETGLAAVAATIEAAPPAMELVAVLETIGHEHRPPMPEHPGLRVTWVDRGNDEQGAANRLLDAVRSEVDSGGTPAFDAAFGAAESRHVSAVRRHLRNERGMPAAAVSMTGYWRRSTQ